MTCRVWIATKLFEKVWYHFLLPCFVVCCFWLFLLFSKFEITSLQTELVCPWRLRTQFRTNIQELFAWATLINLLWCQLLGILLLFFLISACIHYLPFGCWLKWFQTLWLLFCMYLAFIYLNFKGVLVLTLINFNNLSLGWVIEYY